MSQIHIIDGQESLILDYITAENIIDDNHKKSLEDTLETYDFITFADKRFSEHLEKRNRIIIPDEDGSLVEFVIFEAEKYKDTEGYKAQIFANASYLELRKTNVIYPDTYQGTASHLLGMALNGTGRTVGRVEAEGTRTIRIEQHTSPYDFVKRIAKEFECELAFPIEHDGTKVTARYVELLERVGDWRGREVEFGRDLDGIRRVEKQDIVTALLGLGPEREDGTRLEVLVEDYDALQRWGWYDEYGNLNHLIEAYEIESSRAEMTDAEARQYTRTALNKRINTQITYETTIIDLENVPGMKNKKIRFGDTIKIKDTTFNPPLYLEARVFEQTRSIKTTAKKEIKLGDYIEYTEEEVHEIWKQLQKEIKNRVSHYEMVEYTYDKLTIDDKDEIIFEDGKTFAEATGITAEENAKAFAVEEDEKIKVDAEDYADRISEQYAESALEQAKQYAVAKEVYDNQMDRIAADMAEKADLEYIDGKLVDKVNKGDVYTKENVDNMINNTVSKTQYTTDMEGIVTDLESQGTRIGQNEKAIGLKADSTELDAVEQSLTTKIGNVEVKADEVEISVSEVKADLDGLEIGTTNILKGTSPNYKNLNIGQYYSAIEEGARKNLSEYGLKIGDTVTFKIYIKSPSTKGGRARISPFRTDGTYTSLNGNIIEKGKEGYSEVTMKIADDITQILFAIQNDNTSVTASATYQYKEPIVVRGDKIGSWQPAPEDTDEAINQVSGRVETLDGEIRTVAGEVALKASKSVVDSLENRVSTAEGELQVLPGEINAKVSKDGLISEINAQPDNLLIDFPRVKMTNELEAKHIKSLAGLNVNDQFVVDANGKVTIGNNRVTIDDKSISITRPDGAVWMQDGMVFQDYNVTSVDPYDMDYVNLSGNLIDGVFQASRGFYRAGYQAISGGGDYNDIRDPSLGYTVKFTSYEFIHAARYFVIGYRKGLI